MDTYFENQYTIPFERYLEWAKHAKGKFAIDQKRKRLYKQIAGIICGVVIILSGTYLKSWETIWFGTVACLLFIYRLMSVKKIVRKRYETILKTYGAKEWTRNFIFGENIMITEFNACVIYEYNQVTSVTEEKEYFHLMLGDNLVLRILRNGFIKGDQNDFSSFIRERMMNQL